MKQKWIRVSSLGMNRNVLMVDGKESGFIEKPKDNKNFWRIHVGIGENNKFLGHAWTKVSAQRMLESVCVGNVRGLNN